MSSLGRHEATGRGVFTVGAEAARRTGLDVAAARERGIATLGLLGGEGGPALPLCDHAIVIDGVDGAGVQEAHQMIMHMLCEACEAHFAAGAGR